MEILPIKGWGKGLNKDLLPSELGEGFCSDADNIRFVNGFAERVGGLFTYGTSWPITAYANFLYGSTRSTTRGCFHIQAGIAKVYADDLNATNSEITRYTEGVVITSITSVGTTATATTATVHGRTTGDTVSIWGCVPTNYNVTAVITVTGANTFTFTIVSTGGVAATTIGLYSYNGATSNFTGAVDDRWTIGALSGVLIANNPVNGLYYWNGDVATRLRKFPASNVSDVARVFKYFIVQLASTVDGVKLLHNVAWSAAAEPGSIPGSFTASTTNDAGDVDLAETPGKVVDCLPMGDVNIVYKEDARYAMRHVEGNDVFTFTRLPGTDGLLAPGCVVDTPKGHVFLTKGLEVMLHNGGEAISLSKGRIKTVLSALPYAYLKRAFLVTNPAKTEVWVCLVDNTSTTPFSCNVAYIWNWEDDTWGIKTFPALGHVTCGFGGLGANNNVIPVLVFCTENTFSAQLLEAQAKDYTDQFTSTVFTTMIERRGLSFGDPTRMKLLQRSRWHIDAAAGSTSTVYHGSSKTADGTVTYTSGATHTLGTTNFVDARATSGRYLAVKLTYAPPSGNASYALRSSDVVFVLGGTR